VPGTTPDQCRMENEENAKRIRETTASEAQEKFPE
jgi:hypothetical protein